MIRSYGCEPAAGSTDEGMFLGGGIHLDRECAMRMPRAQKTSLAALEEFAAGFFASLTGRWSQSSEGRIRARLRERRTGGWQIWKHSLENGSEIQLTEHGGIDPLESYDGRTIYYSKFDEPGIWSMPVSGGSESVVVTRMPQLGYWGYWAVTESGLYLLDADAEARPTIEFYSFVTGRITPVLSLEKSPSAWHPGLSASRDGRTVFYTQYDPQRVIKMVENFR